MTATSGPGMSLMSEHLGLALMAEIPVVIVDCQRMGPATGGATTVSQGDVQFARWGTPGGYPMIVLAPSTVTECYSLTMRAFDVAERLRTPVILLMDKELATTMTTVDTNDFVSVPVSERPHPMPGQPFTPYRYVPSAVVPPMANIGDSTLVRITGSSHDERGHLTKDPVTVGRLNQHLRAKIEARRDELELVQADVENGAETLVISYGISAGAMREAVSRARARGRRVSAVTVYSLWPIPQGALRRVMEGTQRVVVAELNFGQYRQEIERLAGPRHVIGVHRVDGELITPEEILTSL
jgi:2-oxoglutarate ferredoxin oxidoreductase subunit alpha